jgi:hypothetical protein
VVQIVVVPLANKRTGGARNSSVAHFPERALTLGVSPVNDARVCQRLHMQKKVIVASTVEDDKLSICVRLLLETANGPLREREAASGHHHAGDEFLFPL